MTCEKGTKQWECFNIKDITNNLDPSVIQYLLFAHAFNGYDTTSAIYKFGKIAIFKKTHDSNHLKNLAAEFYNNHKLSEDIGNTATRFFECLYSSTGSTISFLIGIHSMQGWTATTRHGVTRKRSIKRLQPTGNLFRKNLQLVGVC